jgi:ribosomal-protein-alanine N-acetyltransferase
MFPETIETDRLRLERLCRENVPPRELYQYAAEGTDNVEEIAEHVTWNPHKHLKETREFIVEMEETWDEGEGVTYVIRPREGEDGAGEFAGTCGLGIEWPRRSAELGIWLRKPFWGRGYSGERAAALLELAFERLDLEIVTVTHHPDNDQSRRAIEKYVDRFNGRREGELRNFIPFADGSVHDAVRYSIAQEEYREAVEDGE